MRIRQLEIRVIADNEKEGGLLQDRPISQPIPVFECDFDLTFSEWLDRLKLKENPDAQDTPSAN